MKKDRKETREQKPNGKEWATKPCYQSFCDALKNVVVRRRGGLKIDRRIVIKSVTLISSVLIPMGGPCRQVKRRKVPRPLIGSIRRTPAPSRIPELAWGGGRPYLDTAEP